jgi:hypothetical protein
MYNKEVAKKSCDCLLDMLIFCSFNCGCGEQFLKRSGLQQSEASWGDSGAVDAK